MEEQLAFIGPTWYMGVDADSEQEAFDKAVAIVRETDQTPIVNGPSVYLHEEGETYYLIYMETRGY